MRRAVTNALGFWTLFASVAAASPAFGEDSVPPLASAQALELAGLLRPLSNDQAASAADQAKRAIVGNMLRTTLAARGPGCDPQIAACRETADKLALAEARRGIEGQHRLTISNLAILLDARMKPSEIQSAVTFVKTPAGAALASALVSGSDQRSWSAETRSKLERVTREYADANAEALTALDEHFFEETKSLPRRAPIFAPPPPTAPQGRQQ